MSNIYKLQRYNGKSHEDFLDSYSELAVEDLGLPEDFSDLELLPQFKIIQVPTVVSDLVKDFCHSYPQLKYSQLISLIGASQRLYLNYQNNIKLEDQMVQDYETERRELSVLIDLLKEFHFGDRGFIKKLHFYNDDHSLMLKNYFVISDVYKSIIDGLRLNVETPEAYEKRKEELLQKTNQLKFNKASQYARTIVIHAFNNILSVLPISDNKKFAYIGVFLNCCQISITEEKTFLLSSIFHENLSEVSPTAIRNFIFRPPSTSL